MSGSSTRAVLLSAALALALPVAYLILAQFVVSGVLPLERVHPFLGAFGILAALDLLIVGPIGLILLARALGRRGLGAVGLALVLLLPFTIIWFFSVAALSGALGNPF